MTRMGRKPIPAEVRFFAKVRQVGDCWEWIGTKNCGYGHFWHGSGRIYAHRWSYEFFRAPIPSGLQIDHLCRNRACVNAWHLEPVTALVNTLRGESPIAHRAAMDTCSNGHVFDRVDAEGRTCRTCRREIERRHRAKKKANAA